MRPAVTGLDALLGADKLLDLTQPLGPATILWPGSQPFAADVEGEVDTDGFYARDLSLPAGLWHLEGLTRLERVPARGAWLVAAVIPIVDGSGAPARAFAILP